jgi:hypothetical protein
MSLHIYWFTLLCEQAIANFVGKTELPAGGLRNLFPDKCCFLAWFILFPEDGDDMFRNICRLLTDYRRYTPGGSQNITLHNHLCENLKFFKTTNTQLNLRHRLFSRVLV